MTQRKHSSPVEKLKKRLATIKDTSFNNWGYQRSYTVTLYNGSSVAWRYGDMTLPEAKKIKKAWLNREMKKPLPGKQLHSAGIL